MKSFASDYFMLNSGLNFSRNQIIYYWLAPAVKSSGIIFFLIEYSYQDRSQHHSSWHPVSHEVFQMYESKPEEPV